jgi:hypothetical protein
MAASDCLVVAPGGSDGPGSSCGPVGPRGPIAPTGFSSPASPFRPGGPAGTTAPAGPVGPGDPTGPASPLGPCGPAAPTAPAGPVGPGGPAGPASPFGPCGPAAPTAPGSPLGPCAPCSPFSPLRTSSDSNQRYHGDAGYRNVHSFPPLVLTWRQPMPEVSDDRESARMFEDEDRRRVDATSAFGVFLRPTKQLADLNLGGGDGHLPPCILTIRQTIGALSS